MPASTLDPVNTALRASLSKSTSDDTLETQIAGSTKKSLLSNIEFEPAGSYHSTVLDKLKSKYIVLKSLESPKKSNKPEPQMGADETLKLAKYELFPLNAVQLGWTNYDWTVGTGMINMGNTCYLNSTLQALFHVPALVNWLMSDKEHPDCQEGGVCIICAMKKTLQESQQRNINSIRPLLIYNKLRLFSRNFVAGRQEDAHEFLRILVESMEKAYLSRFRNNVDMDIRIKETTPLNQILGGYLRSAVHCLECGHVSTTFQHFQDLLLDIRKAQTLDEALDGYFSREKLDDESYHCDMCRKKVSATKQFSVERSPMVLCIQLKRFSVTNNKLSKHISFRQRLDLTKFSRQRPNVPLIYRLVALVTHMGPSVYCGHYTAIAQSPSGSYYQFDDSTVRPISHQAVFSTNAYIMLYELESAPYTAPSSTCTNKLKTQSPRPLSEPTSSSSSLSKPTTNGIGYTSTKVYGPELPPKVEQKTNNDNNKNSNSVSNGNAKYSDSSLSSESDSDVDKNIPNNKSKKNQTSETNIKVISLKNGVTFTNSTLNNNNNNTETINSKKSNEQATFVKKSNELSTFGNKKSNELPAFIKKANEMSTFVKKSNEASTFVKKSNESPTFVKKSNETSILIKKSNESIKKPTKLVPYDTNDSSNSDSSDLNVKTEAKTETSSGEWKVTSTIDTKTKSNDNTVRELFKMSHSGYAAPVNTWNGTRSELDKEVNNERREERKRALEDSNMDQGRVKHPKIHSNNYKSNPGYNPVQEFQNMRNWNNNSNRYSYNHKQFFSGRHRRNFQHKNYHNKNFRFRQL